MKKDSITQAQNCDIIESRFYKANLESKLTDSITLTIKSYRI
ncbi:hypothetical protein [Helicobacter saguini]|nr:hypothetical protein [Helicobacter saguini]